MNMSTNSYLEYYLSVLAWIINNGIWNTLADTGLFAAPFGAIILQEWLSARQQGADEGNKGLLSIPRVESRICGELDEQTLFVKERIHCTA